MAANTVNARFTQKSNAFAFNGQMDEGGRTKHAAVSLSHGNTKAYLL